MKNFNSFDEEDLPNRSDDVWGINKRQEKINLAIQ
jgi:hypothetical protein